MATELQQRLARQRRRVDSSADEQLSSPHGDALRAPEPSAAPESGKQARTRPTPERRKEDEQKQSAPHVEHQLEASIGSFSEAIAGGLSWLTGGSSASPAPAPGRDASPLHAGAQSQQLRVPRGRSRRPPERMQDGADRHTDVERSSREEPEDTQVLESIRDLFARTQRIELKCAAQEDELRQLAGEFTGWRGSLPNELHQLRQDLDHANAAIADLRGQTSQDVAATVAALADVRQEQSTLEERVGLQEEGLERSLHHLRLEMQQKGSGGSERSPGRSAAGASVRSQHSGDPMDQLDETQKVTRADSVASGGVIKAVTLEVPAAQDLVAEESARRAAELARLEERFEQLSRLVHDNSDALHQRVEEGHKLMRQNSVRERIDATAQAQQALLEEEQRSRQAQKEALEECLTALIDQERGLREAERKEYQDRLERLQQNLASQAVELEEKIAATGAELNERMRIAEARVAEALQVTPTSRTLPENAEEQKVQPSEEHSAMEERIKVIEKRIDEAAELMFQQLYSKRSAPQAGQQAAPQGSPHGSGEMETSSSDAASQGARGPVPQLVMPQPSMGAGFSIQEERMELLERRAAEADERLLRVASSIDDLWADMRSRDAVGAGAAGNGEAPQATSAEAKRALEEQLTALAKHVGELEAVQQGSQTGNRLLEERVDVLTRQVGEVEAMQHGSQTGSQLMEERMELLARQVAQAQAPAGQVEERMEALANRLAALEADPSSASRRVSHQLSHPANQTLEDQLDAFAHRMMGELEDSQHDVAADSVHSGTSVAPVSRHHSGAAAASPGHRLGSSATPPAEEPLQVLSQRFSELEGVVAELVMTKEVEDSGGQMVDVGVAAQLESLTRSIEQLQASRGGSEERLDHFTRQLAEFEASSSERDRRLDQFARQMEDLEASSTGKDERLNLFGQQLGELEFGSGTVRQSLEQLSNKLEEQRGSGAAGSQKLEERLETLAERFDGLEEQRRSGAAGSQKLEDRLETLAERFDELEAEAQRRSADGNRALEERLEALSHRIGEREGAAEEQALLAEQHLTVGARVKALEQALEEVCGVQSQMQDNQQALIAHSERLEQDQASLAERIEILQEQQEQLQRSGGQLVLGRLAAPVTLDQEEEEQRRGAAVLIQSLHRGRSARRGLAEARAQRREGEEQEAEQDQRSAALRIQSLYRGRSVRREVAEERARQDAEQDQRSAALRIQSLYRGRNVRREVAEERARQEAEQDQRNAALRIQSLYRGRNVRREVAEERAKQEAEEQDQRTAALRIQSLYRGRSARRDAAEERARQEEEDQQRRAALRIQSLYRGRNARRDVAEEKGERGLGPAAAAGAASGGGLDRMLNLGAGAAAEADDEEESPIDELMRVLDGQSRDVTALAERIRILEDVNELEDQGIMAQRIQAVEAGLRRRVEQVEQQHEEQRQRWQQRLQQLEEAGAAREVSSGDLAALSERLQALEDANALNDQSILAERFRMVEAAMSSRVAQVESLHEQLQEKAKEPAQAEVPNNLEHRLHALEDGRATEAALTERVLQVEKQLEQQHHQLEQLQLQQHGVHELDVSNEIPAQPQEAVERQRVLDERLSALEIQSHDSAALGERLKIAEANLRDRMAKIEQVQVEQSRQLQQGHPEVPIGDGSREEEAVKEELLRELEADVTAIGERVRLMEELEHPNILERLRVLEGQSSDTSAFGRLLEATVTERLAKLELQQEEEHLELQQLQAAVSAPLVTAARSPPQRHEEEPEKGQTDADQDHTWAPQAHQQGTMEARLRILEGQSENVTVLQQQLQVVEARCKELAESQVSPLETGEDTRRQAVEAPPAVLEERIVTVERKLEDVQARHNHLIDEQHTQVAEAILRGDWSEAMRLQSRLDAAIAAQNKRLDSQHDVADRLLHSGTSASPGSRRQSGAGAFGALEEARVEQRLHDLEERAKEVPPLCQQLRKELSGEMASLRGRFDDVAALAGQSRADWQADLGAMRERLSAVETHLEETKVELLEALRSQPAKGASDGAAAEVDFSAVRERLGAVERGVEETKSELLEAMQSRPASINEADFRGVCERLGAVERGVEETKSELLDALRSRPASVTEADLGAVRERLGAVERGMGETRSEFLEALRSRPESASEADLGAVREQVSAVQRRFEETKAELLERLQTRPPSALATADRATNEADLAVLRERLSAMERRLEDTKAHVETLRSHPTPGFAHDRPSEAPPGEMAHRLTALESRIKEVDELESAKVRAYQQKVAEEHNEYLTKADALLDLCKQEQGHRATQISVLDKRLDALMGHIEESEKKWGQMQQEQVVDGGRLQGRISEEVESVVRKLRLGQDHDGWALPRESPGSPDVRGSSPLLGARVEALEGNCGNLARTLDQSIQRLDGISSGLHKLEAHVTLALAAGALAAAPRRGRLGDSINLEPEAQVTPIKEVNSVASSPDLQRLRAVIDQMRNRGGSFDDTVVKAMSTGFSRAEQRFSSVLGFAPSGDDRGVGLVERHAGAVWRGGDETMDRYNPSTAVLRDEMGTRLASAEAHIRATELGLDRELKRQVAELSARLGQVETQNALSDFRHHISEISSRLGKLESRWHAPPLPPLKEEDRRFAALESEVRLTSSLVHSLLERQGMERGPPQRAQHGQPEGCYPPLVPAGEASRTTSRTLSPQ